MKIQQKKQTKYNVEIKLTEEALKFIMNMAGDSERLRGYYKEMEAEHYGVVTSNPSFDLGFGAEINDLLSIGMLVYSKIYAKELEISELPLSELSLHPFRNKLPIFGKIDYLPIDGEIEEHDYQMMTTAVEKSTGKSVEITEDGSIQYLKEEDDEADEESSDDNDISS